MHIHVEHCVYMLHGYIMRGGKVGRCQHQVASIGHLDEVLWMRLCAAKDIHSRHYEHQMKGTLLQLDSIGSAAQIDVGAKVNVKVKTKAKAKVKFEAGLRLKLRSRLRLRSKGNADVKIKVKV